MKAREMDYKYGKFLKIGIVVLSVAALNFTLNVRIARADPHGVFYTAIGQQQLFFNVLAALDQADYVETSFDREARRQAREAVTAEQPFAKETESGGRFTGETEIASDAAGESASDQTQPGTPALLNRAVTLEGADLYTDQLVRDFGAESARRNAAAELLQTLCSYGFGIEGCDNEIKPGLTPQEQQAAIEERELRRASAVVVDPLEWSAMPYTYGVLPALNSGTETDELQRQIRLLYPDLYDTPFAYSSQIDFWRKQIQSLIQKNPNEGAQQQQYLEKLINEVIVSMNPSRKLTPWPYAELVENQAGGYDYRHILMSADSPGACWPQGASPPCLEYEWGKNSGFQSATEYIDWVDRRSLSGLNTIHRIATEAADRVISQQAITENEGVKAHTSLASKPAAVFNYPPNPFPSLSNVGEIYWQVDSPVAARAASIYGIPNVLGQLATSQQASSLTGLDNPGGVQLVKRGDTAGSQTPECSNGINDDNDNYIDYPEDGDCASPTDTSEGQPGPQSAVANSGAQVAGALDMMFKPNENFFDKTKDPTSPSANIISPILEFGARHALRVMTAGTWRPGTTAGITCGFTCD